jgi:hypothetical protein
MSKRDAINIDFQARIGALIKKRIFRIAYSGLGSTVDKLLSE